MNNYLKKVNKFIEITTKGTQENGYLSFIESNNNIPFEIKRIYYVYDVPLNTKRGMHAHKRLQQFLWCPFGSIEVIIDDGKVKSTYLLDSPQKGLLVLAGDWHDMYWKKENSVLCVVASDYYNEEDYIRDYDQFKKYVEKGYWDNEG